MPLLMAYVEHVLCGDRRRYRRDGRCDSSETTLKTVEPLTCQRVPLQPFAETLAETEWRPHSKKCRALWARGAHARADQASQVVQAAALLVIAPRGSGDGEDQPNGEHLQRRTDDVRQLRHAGSDADRAELSEDVQAHHAHEGDLRRKEKGHGVSTGTAPALLERSGGWRSSGGGRRTRLP